MSKKLAIAIFLIVLLFTAVILVYYYLQKPSYKVSFKSEINQTRLVSSNQANLDKYVTDIGFWQKETFIRKLGDEKLPEKSIKPTSLSVVVKEGESDLDRFSRDKKVYRSLDWVVGSSGKTELYILINSQVIGQANLDRDRVISEGFIRGVYFISKKGIVAKAGYEEINNIVEVYKSNEPLIKLISYKRNLWDNILDFFVKNVSAACGGSFVECGLWDWHDVCNGGSKDGQECNTNIDCPGGTCVTEGFCNSYGSTLQCGDLTDYQCTHGDVCNLFWPLRCTVENYCSLGGGGGPTPPSGEPPPPGEESPTCAGTSSTPSCVNNGGNWTVSASGVQNATSVWVNGYDDRGWQVIMKSYPATNMGGGTWQATIPQTDLGGYQGHMIGDVFMSNGSYSNISCPPQQKVSICPTLSCTVSGDPEAICNVAEPYSAHGTITNGSINKTELFWSPTSTQSWTAISSANGPDTSGNATFPSSTTYWVVCNAFDTTRGLICTGNPFGISPGLQDCGPASRKQVTVTCPVINNPVGYHLSSSCDSSTGYACDADNYSTPLTIHFYADGAAGAGGTYIGQTLANLDPGIFYRDFVAGACGGNYFHAFSFPTPAELQDGNVHSIYAYAINIGSGNQNPLLTNSPQSIQCGVCTPPSSPTNLHVSPDECDMTSTTFSWSPPEFMEGQTPPDRYAVRVNDMTAAPTPPANTWSGSCVPGELYEEDSCSTQTSTDYPRSVIPGHTYQWWVHSIKDVCGWSEPTYSLFTVSECTSNPWWQVVDADVFSKVDISSLINTEGVKFDLDGGGGFPGVPFYVGSIDTGFGDISSKDWNANTVYGGERYDYAYFHDKIPGTITPYDITEASRNSAQFLNIIDSGCTTANFCEDSNGYNWLRATNTSGFTLSSAVDLGNRKVILFVEDSDSPFTTNGNIALNDGTGFLMVISNSNISINQNVTSIEGIYVADGTFSTSTDGSDSALNVRGSVVVWDGGISLDRQLTDNATASEIFTYAPDLILRIPSVFGRRSIIWKEVVP